VAALKHEVARNREQLAAQQARIDELVKVLKERDPDGEMVKDLRARNSALTAANAELQQRLAARGEDLDTLVVQLASMERIVVSLERTIEQVRGRGTETSSEVIDVAKPAEVNWPPDANAPADWDSVRAALELQRQRTIEDVRRAAGSRAWRWGHGVTRLLRTLTFRRSVRNAGAMDALLERLENEELPLPIADSAAEDDPTAA